MITDISRQFVVVLDRPQDSVNIGAAVRAVKNMGFSQIRLVNPRPYATVELTRVAHHAEDVIAAIRTYTTLDAALADTIFVVGTAAVTHPDRPLRRDIPALSRELVQRAQGGTIALLFGTEDDGLDTGAMDRCHCLATLPANPDYPALNLAQSVLLFLYELSKYAGTTGAPQPGETVQPLPAAVPQPAPQALLEQLFAVGEEALAAIDFFKYSPQTAMRTLRQLAYRAELHPQEAALLMAMARQLLYYARHTPGRDTGRDTGRDPEPNKTTGVT